MARAQAPFQATAALVLAGTATAAGAADPGDPAKPPAAAPDDLHAAIESVVGTHVHGTLSLRYRYRSTSDATDQDFFQVVDVHAGDESRDAWSGALLLRTEEDLDHAHEDDHGFVFRSIEDTADHWVNAWLYAAYVAVRPATGAVETVRLGRQYVEAAETFHLDGASATTRPLVESIGLVLTAYGGVPVHLHESGSSGDWLAGLRLSAEPWKGTRAALDYTHDQDDLSLLGSKARNDFAAVSVWQEVAKNAELFGQFTWLEGPRDVTVRGTVSFPEHDLVLQASYFRLIEDQRELATEFDPYTTVIQELQRYQQAELRVGKGFGEHFDVDAGAMVRELLPGEDESAFNHDTRRVWITPTVSDLPWKGTSVSVTGESLWGDDERLTTWGLEVMHRFGPRFEASVGSDYSLYDFGPSGTDERSHVRTAYGRLEYPLTKTLRADLRYTWEKDDVETFHVLTLAIVLDF